MITISSWIHCHSKDCNYSLRRLLMSRQFVAFLKESYVAAWIQLTYTMLWLSRPRESPWRNPMKKSLRWNDTEGCLVNLSEPVVFANSHVSSYWQLTRSCSQSVASSPAVDGNTDSADRCHMITTWQICWYTHSRAEVNLCWHWQCTHARVWLCRMKSSCKLKTNGNHSQQY